LFFLFFSFLFLSFIFFKNQGTRHSLESPMGGENPTCTWFQGEIILLVVTLLVSQDGDLGDLEHFQRF
jgi:hypothetical protein